MPVGQAYAFEHALRIAQHAVAVALHVLARGGQAKARAAHIGLGPVLGLLQGQHGLGHGCLGLHQIAPVQARQRQRHADRDRQRARAPAAIEGIALGIGAGRRGRHGGHAHRQRGIDPAVGPGQARVVARMLQRRLGDAHLGARLQRLGDQGIGILQPRVFGQFHEAALQRVAGKDFGQAAPQRDGQRQPRGLRLGARLHHFGLEAVALHARLQPFHAADVAGLAPQLVGLHHVAQRLQRLLLAFHRQRVAAGLGVVLGGIGEQLAAHAFKAGLGQAHLAACGLDARGALAARLQLHADLVVARGGPGLAGAHLLARGAQREAGVRAYAGDADAGPRGFHALLLRAQQGAVLLHGVEVVGKAQAGRCCSCSCSCSCCGCNGGRRRLCLGGGAKAQQQGKGLPGEEKGRLHGDSHQWGWLVAVRCPPSSSAASRSPLSPRSAARRWRRSAARAARASIT